MCVSHHQRKNRLPHQIFTVWPDWPLDSPVAHVSVIDLDPTHQMHKPKANLPIMGCTTIQPNVSLYTL